MGFMTIMDHKTMFLHLIYKVWLQLYSNTV